MPNVESISILSVAQAGMFAVLCLLGVRSRPARNLLLLSPAAVSLAGLLYWAPRRQQRRQQRQGRAGPEDSRRLSLVPGSRAPAGPAAAVQPRHTGAAPPSH